MSTHLFYKLAQMNWENLGLYWTKLTTVFSEGSFLASPAGAGVQGGSAPFVRKLRHNVRLV